jgi:hypothetical protein
VSVTTLLKAFRESHKTPNIQLFLKRLVLGLIEESRQDLAFKFMWSMNFERILSWKPRNDLGEILFLGSFKPEFP